MKRGSADPPEPRRVPVAQAMVQKLLGVHDGIPDPEAKPQIGRNGGGQRATVPWLFEVFTPGCFNAMSGSSGEPANP